MNKTQLQINPTDDEQKEFTFPPTTTDVENHHAENFQLKFSTQPNITLLVNKQDSISPNSFVSLKSDWNKVSLEPNLTLAQLKDLKECLEQYHGSRVQLCGAKVERVDTAALQLLMAFINSSDVTVGWVTPSPKLCHAAQLLGLTSYLGLPTEQLSSLYIS